MSFIPDSHNKLADLINRATDYPDRTQFESKIRGDPFPAASLGATVAPQAMLAERCRVCGEPRDDRCTFCCGDWHIFAT
jgi:hypothetical protein